MKKSTLIKVMTLFIIALCVFGTVTCNKTDDSMEEVRSMRNYQNSDGNFESDLSNYESIRLYIISEDSNPSGMRFMEDGSLQRFGNASIGTYSTVKGEFNTRTNMKNVAACFPMFLKEIHNSDNYAITYFEHFYLDNSEVIKMEYVIDEDYDNPESIMIYTDLSKTSKAAPPTTIIKCMGHCDSATEDCVEIHKNGEVRCSCQSDDCYMVVKEVQSGSER